MNIYNGTKTQNLTVNHYHNDYNHMNLKIDHFNILLSMLQFFSLVLALLIIFSG